MQIASVYGISQDKAYTIKSKCDSYARKLRSELKIKLSVDNKSKEATKVIQAIYVYMKKMEFSKQIDELDELYGKNLKDSFKVFNKVSNGVI